jgi:hypothetical protein
MQRERSIEVEPIVVVDGVALLGLGRLNCLTLFDRSQDSPWVQQCVEVEEICSILNDIRISPFSLVSAKDDSLGVAELGEPLTLLIAVCDPVPGEGDGERMVAQCLETDDEDDGTPRLVLMGGV